MEAVIFIGIQATGKSTFYKERFFDTHVRINLDMLRTRHREQLLLQACLAAKQPFVVDNTNPTAEDRARYIRPAKAAGFRVIGYYFPSDLEGALARNVARPARARVPEAGIRGTRKRLQPPSLKEGFDALYCVKLASDGQFLVQQMEDGLLPQAFDRPGEAQLRPDKAEKRSR
jgi:predicted kinase